MIDSNEIKDYVFLGEGVRKRKSRRAKRRKSKVKLCIEALLVIALCLVAVIWIFNYPHRKINNGIIIRNLNNSSLFITKLFDEEPNTAWDSDLPSFAQRDLKLAKEKGYTIEYKYGSTTIEEFFEDDVAYLSLNTPYVCNLPYSFSEYDLTNFSMYYSKQDDAIVIYGYHTRSNLSECFKKYTLYSDVTKSPDDTILTYDSNLPLDINNFESMSTIPYGDYSLYFDEETTTFYFYKDGVILSSQKFLDSVEYFYKKDGLIKTKNNLLYKIYSYEMDGGIPTLKFVFISEDADPLLSSKSSSYCKSIYSETDSLPLIIKDGEYYIFEAEDGETYKNYGIFGNALQEHKANLNYNINLVALRDKFVYAEFSKEYSNTWEVKFYFNVDGELYSTKYQINGYDSSVYLDNSKVEKLSIRVDSLGKVWNQIEEIRKAYEPYYTHGFDDLLE